MMAVRPETQSQTTAQCARAAEWSHLTPRLYSSQLPGLLVRLDPDARQTPAVASTVNSSPEYSRHPPTSVTGYATDCSGHPLGQGATRTVPVAGVDGLPAAGGSSPVVAMIANITAVSGTANTYFTRYPSDVAQPNASDLNVAPGQIPPTW